MRTVTLTQFLDKNKKLAHTRKPLQRATSVPVVDLYAGIGGFSTGAAAAGHRVELVVDGWYDALHWHSRNHPDAEHHYAWLPDDSLLDKLPPPDSLYHLHGSPPCQKLSQGNTLYRNDGSASEGLANVQWFLEFVRKARPASWTMEQVSHKLVIDLLKATCRRWPGWMDFEVCKMEEWGVPQTRCRVIAGSPFLIRRLRDRRQPLKRVTMKQVLTDIPKGAIGVKGQCMYDTNKNGQGRHAFKRSAARSKEARMKGGGGLAQPSPTVMAGNTIRWCARGGETITNLTTHQHAALQTFPPNYKFPDDRKTGQLLCGNAVPPKFAEILMSDYRLPAGRGALEEAVFPPRPQSPSLLLEE